MESRRWLNRYQPQTLVTGTMLLYIEGLFNLVRGTELMFIGLAMFPAAYAIANDRRWGWRLGVGAAAVAVLLRIGSIVSYGFTPIVLLILVFPVALLALLVHPISREYQRVWFS
ncbi:MAG: hypothetical protein MAG471_00866 [Acidimicrobiaceae bacterium]|nr:hypothetical protein [Acidimicrobiaceae bacterium]